MTRLRQPSDESSFPGSLRELGWWGVLPPIIHGGRRWWLPLSDTALVALSHVISSSDGRWGVPNPIDRVRLTDAFAIDPPLLLFALMKWPGDEVVTATELAEWLIGYAPDEFSGGQWILSAPEISNRHQSHWSRLIAQSRRVDPSDWIGHAAAWLEVIGPQVDPEWIECLPRVIWDVDHSVRRPIEGSQWLQRLSRSRQRELVVEDCLSELAEKRKNAAAKQLAYGLSHEINNPLANISARAQQLARDETDPKRIQSLQAIVQQVYRAHEMIAGLMFFAHPPDVDRRSVDLNEIIGQAAAEYQSVAAAQDIRLIAHSAAGPAVVTVDRLMILEAIRVLLRNSIEAIGVGGTIVLSLHDGGSEDADPSQGDDETQSGCWLIHVADSGPGLSPEASRHAFDPFYSGREAGRGLGLGLCRAYRVAKLHDATIRLSAGLAGCVATLSIPR